MFSEGSPVGTHTPSKVGPQASLRIAEIWDYLEYLDPRHPHQAEL